MPSQRDLADALGIDASGDERPELGPAVGRIVALLRRGGHRSLGLLPAADDVAVPALALQIGLALARVSGTPTAVLDAQGTWPWRSPTRRVTPAFAVDRITDRLILLTPRTIRAVAALEVAVAAGPQEAAVAENVVVDLTGLDHTGEYIEMIARLDGTAVVARTGRTSLRQLRRALAEVVVAKRLGVILLGT